MTHHGWVVPSATLLFDGDCSFCTKCAMFIERWIHSPARVVAWQFVDPRSYGLTSTACTEALQWVVRDGLDGLVVAQYAGPMAIAELLRSSRSWYWRGVGWWLSRPGVAMLSWPVYRWVARHRDRFPGGTAACAVAPARRNGTCD